MTKHEGQCEAQGSRPSEVGEQMEGEKQGAVAVHLSIHLLLQEILIF